jgi:hypothetical protein
MFQKMAYFRDNSVSLRELAEPFQRVSSALNNDLAAVRLEVERNKLQQSEDGQGFQQAVNL